MEHAHPIPEALPVTHHGADLPRPPEQPTAFHNVPVTPSSLRSPHPSEVPLSLQHRRLQLRNSGFRATKFPSHRLTARSKWASTRDEYEKNSGCSQENQPPAVARESWHAKYGNISSILQEITNSTRARKGRRRPGIAIFEDPPDQPSHEEGPSPHELQQSPPSQLQSYPTSSSILDREEVAALREMSSNEYTPPLSSHLTKQMRRKRKGILDSRKNSNDLSQYVEHLESQLASVQRSLTSPKTGRPIQDKVRKTSQDNRRLKQLIEEWEERFDLRVKQAIEHQASMESDLRRKIKTLEDEIVLRDCTIRDLQCSYDSTKKDLGNVEALRLSMERLESSKNAVEATNRSLEKRNDVLTELLAQSPTRLLHAAEPASASLNLNAWTTPRPRPRPRPMSMLPQLPSSSDSPYTWRPLSLQVSPITVSGSDLLGDQATITPKNKSPGVEHNSLSNTISRPSGLGYFDSLSLQSGTIQPSSQRSSIISLSSENSSTFDLPLPLSSPADRYEKASRDRRSRRFAPGSTGLKPLLLPTLPCIGAGNLVTTTEPLQPILSDQVSRKSIQSASEFVSSPGAYDTPTQPKRRSSTRIDKETLRALEGNHESRVSNSEEVLRLDQGLENNFCHPPLRRLSLVGEADLGDLVPRSLAVAKPKKNNNRFKAIPCSNDSYARLERQQSKHNQRLKEHLNANLATPSQFEPGFRPIPPLNFNLRANDAICQGGELRKKESPAGLNDCTCSCKRQESELRVLSAKLDQSSCHVSTEQSQARSHTSCKCSQSLTKSNPAASSFFVNRIMSRALSYSRIFFGELRNNPTALAYHIVANAWHSCWKRMGDFSWWVLGLFLGARREVKAVPGRSSDHCSHRAQEAHGSGMTNSINANSSHDRTREKPSKSSNGKDSGLENRFSSLLSHPCSYLDTPHDEHAQSADEIVTEQTNQHPRKGWRTSIYLWGKFSFAIALAIGGALVEGPEEMLRTCGQPRWVLDQAVSSNRKSRSPEDASPISRPMCCHSTFEQNDNYYEMGNSWDIDGANTETAFNISSPSTSSSTRMGTVRRTHRPGTLATPPRPSTAPPASLDHYRFEPIQDRRFRVSAFNQSWPLVSDSSDIATRDWWDSGVANNFFLN